MLLAAVKANLGDEARQVLGDAGFRSASVFERLKDCPSELIVALGREGKHDLEIDTQIKAEFRLVCLAIILRRLCSLHGT